jgi:hypothetical protein
MEWKMKVKERKFKSYTPLKGKSIYIGGVSYKVKYFKTIEGLDPDDEEYDPEAWTAGYSDLSSREVGIFAYLTREEHAFVLLHELIHCTMECVKTDQIFQKEDFIKPLSRFLFDAMRQCDIIKRPRPLKPD